MNRVVVYKTQPETVPQVLHLLRQQGMHPTSLDNPDSIIMYASKGTYLVRISVPEEEVQQAQTILSNWEKSHNPDIELQIRSLRTHFIYSILVTIIIGLIGYFTGNITFDNIGWLTLVWLVSFILIANGKRIRGNILQYLKRNDKPLFPRK